MSRIKFSQRMGFVTPKVIQVEEIDNELRMVIWNLIHITYTAFIKEVDKKFDFRKFIWMRYLYKPLDELTESKFINQVKEYINKEKWYKVYDILEEIIEYLDSNHGDIKNTFVAAINFDLEKHNAAFRYVGNEFTPISDKIEIQSIQEALDESKGRFFGTHTHLSTALKHLSDRENPDYRNSIKESISAVESISQKICGDNSATLGKALNKIESENGVELHKALKEGYKKIYGYTADEDGIRHALLEKDTLNFEDAKYMLVSCSAFINYLIVKADKAGIFKESN